jgi:hypothetical protein
MPPKGPTKGKDPKGKGSAVYFASQQLVRPPYKFKKAKSLKSLGHGGDRIILALQQEGSERNHIFVGFWLRPH